MSTNTDRPSHAQRKSSHVPGGFETETETEDEHETFSPSPLKPSFSRSRSQTFDPNDSSASTDIKQESSALVLPPLQNEDSSGILDVDHSGHAANGSSADIDEGEMRKKLLDIESSFLPELSHLAGGGVGHGLKGADDTYLFGMPRGGLGDGARGGDVEAIGGARDGEAGRSVPSSPMTPPESYKTPAPEYQSQRLHEDQIDREGASHTPNAGDNTSSLETMSSSPTAAAAARTVSRVVSMATMGGYETADDRSPEHPPTRGMTKAEGKDLEATPKKSRKTLDTRGDGGVSPTPGLTGEIDEEESHDSQASPRKRPKFLTSRQSTQRFSYSSHHSSNTDGASDATLGADFALQSGGAVPANNSSRQRPSMGLSRSTSLGSMASGISSWSDGEEKTRTFSGAGAGDHDLSTLSEEDTTQPRPSTAHRDPADGSNGPLTPKALPKDLVIPTDTILAAHVRDIEIPGTFARNFREKHRSFSPEKRPGAPTPSIARSGKTMTLKEQSSTIDRLSKENFDLKMRIHFLNEALNKRSEEGIKEMISENVELKSDKMKLQKDNQTMRRTIRDLEKRLKDQTEEGKEEKGDGEDSDGGKSYDEEEFLFLRERVETYELELEKMRNENILREGEKRRLAEMVKTLGDSRKGGSEVGAREERDMWKDMLEAETAAREQADEENKRLRDEIMRLRSDAFSVQSQKSTRRTTRRSVVSDTTGSDRGLDRGGAVSGSSGTLVELDLLRHENAELRREVGAQTSMLTSRNREKERLYQEIEDLKLTQRGGIGGRSVAGDSIFERSASRAASRVSDGTRISAHMSDAERDNYEVKNGELRDQVSALKLENQTLSMQLDEVTADLLATDRQYQADVETATRDINELELERDDALKMAEEREAEFQALKAEAQEEIDALGDELDEKHDEAQRLETELRNTDENFKALQAEMRSMSEGIIRLEDDAQANLEKYKAVQQDLEASSRDVDNLETALSEANSKVQRLTVQQESSQNEIAFLREEQDGDKIKIGDLESALKTSQMSLQSEKDRTKELDRRLAEERHQREVVGSKEKQEVQRIVNDLNREASAARDEARKLKKALSSREIEANTWKERLTELENSLREALGDLNGTRSSLISSITRLQKELESTSIELETTRSTLDEKERTLRNRDTLLESHGLESRKLADLLEKERQARRADKHSFEQSLKSHQQANRTISQNNSRIAELEAARQQDRKKLGQLEQQYKDQLSERNSILLSIWKRLSAMCGPDWAHSNSLINGNLPSQEVVGNILFWPGFSRNLLLAVKTVENLIGGFKTRIKTVERDLWREYQTLEHNLDLRVKKLDRLEETARSIREAQTTNPEMTKLRGENRLLKAELNLLHKQELHSRHHSHTTSGDSRSSKDGITRSSTAHMAAAQLMRHHSSSAVEGVQPSFQQHQSQPLQPQTQLDRPSRSNSITSRNGLNLPPGSTVSSSYVPQTGEEKWIHRLRELERRLKAEREARLLDRSGARKRLEEEGMKNDELRAELERERIRGRVGVERGDGGGAEEHEHEQERERQDEEAGDGDADGEEVGRG